MCTLHCIKPRWDIQAVVCLHVIFQEQLLVYSRCFILSCSHCSVMPWSCICQHVRTYEGEGADPRHSVSGPGNTALLSAWALQREALLRHPSGSEGNLIFTLCTPVCFPLLSLESSIVFLSLLTSPEKSTHSLIRWPRKTATEQLTAKRTRSQRTKRQRVTEHKQRRKTWKESLCPRANWWLTRFRRRPCDPFSPTYNTHNPSCCAILYSGGWSAARQIINVESITE